MTRESVYIGLVEHFGDIVACEPVARYVKAKYPDKKIVWVASPVYAELLETNPYIDRFIPSECLTEWIRMAKHARKDSLVIDLHVNYRICEVCRVPLIKTVGNPSVNVHNWYHYGSLLEAFSFGAGLPKLTDAPAVYIQESNVRHVDSLGLPGSFIVIHRHSNEVLRDWTDHKWELLLELVHEPALAVVEIGAPPKAGKSFQLRCANYVDLRGKTSILDSAEVIRRSKLFIGVDSGPAHLANAVKAPAVIILGTFGNFRRYIPYTGHLASDNPSVKIVRNPAGAAADLSVRDVHDAICYALNRPEDVRQEEPRASVVPASAGAERFNPKVLAFYLPQFHPIPENNEAWEPGFTEWTSVIRAKPLYDGHRQPVEPGELGYYDLRSADVLREQARLATEHGIDGFCFYYYYFSGKHLMNRPLENMVEQNIELPFCLLWANHNWTKKWDAGDEDVIIHQSHSDFDDLYFIRNLYNYFRRDNYIKVNGKPLLGIFMPNLFTDIKRTIGVWRDDAIEAGFDGLYLFMVDDWAGPIHSPENYGFDATYEMPSNTLSRLDDHSDEVKGLAPDFTGRILDYDQLAAHFIARSVPSYKRLRTVMAPWDNSPRYKERAIVCRTQGLDAYRRWLMHACVETYRYRHDDERIVFLHSWNEWAEGTFIEPSAHEGRARLEATRAAVEASRKIIDVISRSDSPLEFDESLIEYFQYLCDLDENAYRNPLSGVEPVVLQRWETQKNNLEIEKNNLEIEKNNLERELDILWNSRSMRLTKPLRYATEKLRPYLRGRG